VFAGVQNLAVIVDELHEFNFFFKMTVFGIQTKLASKVGQQLGYPVVTPSVLAIFVILKKCAYQSKTWHAMQ